MSEGFPAQERVGEAMHELMVRLYPICRSITGDGVRKTLAILQEMIPLTVHEVPTGTAVLDWVVPKEWNIRDAYVRRPDGHKVADFQVSNLCVVGYSAPIHAWMSLEELRPHLHTLPKQPDVIPYRTSYYNETWGFCIPHRDYEQLPEGKYEVMIDSTLSDGAMTYGEYVIPGEERNEVLLSCYVCHPSMCNDNLSGIVLCTFLARALQEQELRYTYRFLFIPETIGAITWLACNPKPVQQICHGLVVTCVGDSGPFTYKRSRRGAAEIDRAVAYVLKERNYDHRVLDFFPMGSDERQFCSPGFNLSVGSLMRSAYWSFPEYHTSADNQAFVQPAALGESYRAYSEIVEVLEGNRVYHNTHPYGEPQLGRRGLYRTIGGDAEIEGFQEAVMWVLNLSDGCHSLLDIAERSGLAFDMVRSATDALAARGLVAGSLADA